MLLSFRVANFLSIRDEQEFSFVNGSSTPNPGAEGWDSSVGTLAGIFGANASGKSNVLKALNFMHDAITSSYVSWASKDSIPATPFALDSTYEREPSLFEAEFQLQGIRYQYGFRVTKQRVVSEWLYAYVTHRRQVWFERDADDDDPWYFGKSFTGRNRVIADLTRPTALFLSSAVANNHQMALVVQRFFRTHLRSASPGDAGTRTFQTKSMSSNKGHWSAVVDLMRFADLGIRDVRVRRETLDDLQHRLVTTVFKAIQEAGGEGTGELESASLKVIDSMSDQVEFGHSVGANDNPVYLPLKSESLGTQSWFALAGPIVRALRSGETLIVDEIDSSLHPHLTAEVLRIFTDPERNPKQAQLLFTSHDTTLLGGLLDDVELTRDQVWFTEKKADGATVLYPLTDFSPRKTENLERGYLQGRYGAVPYLNRSLLPEVTKQAAQADDPGTGAEAGSDTTDTDTDELR
jgi:predicted ATP-dependent endonuclease of OLD family